MEGRQVEEKVQCLHFLLATFLICLLTFANPSVGTGGGGGGG